MGGRTGGVNMMLASDTASRLNLIVRLSLRWWCNAVSPCKFHESGNFVFDVHVCLLYPLDGRCRASEMVSQLSLFEIRKGK